MKTEMTIYSCPYSAFILNDNGTWSQPVFWLEVGATEADVLRCLGGRGDFWVGGLDSDPDASVITPEQDYALVRRNGEVG